MKKKKWVATALLTAALLAAGCSANTPPSGEGYVLERNGGSSYIIIGEMTADDAGKTWNELFEAGYSGDAIVLRLKGDPGLDVGDKVKYWIDGGVNLSYPAQAAAKKVEKTGDIYSEGGD